MRPAINLDPDDDKVVIKFLQSLPHGSISQIIKGLLNAATIFGMENKNQLGDLYVGTYKIITTRLVDASKRERTTGKNKGLTE